MLFNSLKIAFRNLMYRKGYALLNIAGLALGVTCCLLIFQYVSTENNYDRFEQDYNHIYRLRLDQYKQGQLSWQSATIYPAIGPTLKRDYPEVESFCRLHDLEALLMNTEKNIKFTETKGYFADPDAIPLLGIQLQKGNPSTVLDAADKMIISSSMAKKYFGTEEVIGKILDAPGGQFPQHFEITGVFKDYPQNSHLIINYLASYATMGKLSRLEGDTTNQVETSFGWYDFYTYLKFKPGTDVKKFEKKLPAFCDKYINSQEWAKNNSAKGELYVLPLSDIHLHSNYNQEAEVNGNGNAVRFMFLIGFVIIFIAWINYINLATARSMERAREVGVRKLLGAVRFHLIRQFMLESFLLNILAVALAAIAVYFLTQPFNALLSNNQSTGFHLTPTYWGLFIGLFVAGTFLSGIYPAFVLSGYQPVKVLKGAFKNTAGGLSLRKALIIVQFGISVILIAGTIIVYQQVRYMRGQGLGVNINQTLVLDGAQSITDSLFQNTFQPFKDDLLKQPGVKSVSNSTSVMGKEIYWTNGVNRMEPGSVAVTLYILGVDYDFIPQYEVNLITGRNFNKSFGTDRQAALLNEVAVKSLGFQDAQHAIGKKITRGAGDTLNVIGVVQSFHHLGLQKPIDPQLILLRPNARQAYSIKMQQAGMQQQIAGIQKTWNKYFPNDPFNYYFLDEYFNSQYKGDQQFGNIFSLFALLAISIACFGLLGLSAYNILQRTKEVGIRKVLGASNKSVVFILSKDFLVLVGIAFLISAPVAWIIMHNWLQDFAYRIEINWLVFVLAGIVSVVIALGTIGFQAMRAAVANPVKSLRSE